MYKINVSGDKLKKQIRIRVVAAWKNPYRAIRRNFGWPTMRTGES